MKRTLTYISIFAAIALTGCAAAPSSQNEEPAAVASAACPRECPPLPILRPGASALERRIHTQTIVMLYARCAGGGEDVP